jgi:mevalonate kinase
MQSHSTPDGSGSETSGRPALSSAVPVASGASHASAAGATSSTGRAWGKVILLGEHAVVYGVPALAIGIDRGAHATSMTTADAKSRLDVAAWNVSVAEDDVSTDLGRAFAAILSAARALPVSRSAAIREASVVVAAHAELPPGGGLGCSAALGVAVARALVPESSAHEAAELAMAWERVFHGNPSGIDAAVASHGGSILFEKGSPMQSVPLKVGLTVCLGSTGVASSTKTMVDGVARLRERKPELVEKSFSGIASLVRNARLALEAGDVVGLGKLMDLNQMLLSGLYLSTEEIERLCGSARDAGALGAKLTGAGGGGCVVALAADAAAAEGILAAWKTAGFDGFAANVHATGEEAAS